MQPEESVVLLVGQIWKEEMKTSLEQRQPDCESAAALRCSALVESTRATDDKQLEKLPYMFHVYFWMVFRQRWPGIGLFSENS